MSSNAVQIILDSTGILAVTLAGLSTIYSALMYHRSRTNTSNITNRDCNATDSAPPAQDAVQVLLERKLSEISDLLVQIHEQSERGTAEIKGTLEDLVNIQKNEAHAEFIVQRRSPRNHHAAAG